MKYLAYSLVVIFCLLNCTKNDEYLKPWFEAMNCQ